LSFTIYALYNFRRINGSLRVTPGHGSERCRSRLEKIVALLNLQTNRRDKAAKMGTVFVHESRYHNRRHYHRRNGRKHPARCGQKKLKVSPISLVLTGSFSILDAISVCVNTGVDLGIEFAGEVVVVACGVYFWIKSHPSK
jgi:hypothetical protein